MAGQDQSARLQGLLSGIAGSVGELGAGGEWAGNAVRTAARPDFMAGSFGNPEFDMNNVDNLNAMANWASRNGYEDQAKQYMALSYRQKEKEEQEAEDAALGKTLAGAALTGSDAQQAGNEGDLESASAKIGNLKALLEQEDIQASPEAVLRISATIESLNSQSEQFRKNQTQSSARALAGLDMRLSTLDQSDPNYATKKANIEKTRADLLLIPGVEEVYEGNRLSLMDLRNKKVSAQWTAQSSAIIKELSDAGTDLTKIAAIEDRYTQFAPQIIGIKGEMIRQAREMEELLSDKFDVKQLPTRIRSERERIEASAMSDREKDNANRLLDDVQTRYDSGYALQGAVAQFATAQQNNNQIINNSNAAEAGVERQRTDRAVVRAEGAKQAAQKGPSIETVRSLVEFNTGEKWEDLKEDEAQELYEKAEADLMEPLLEYWERANIDAGYEPPKELDGEDIRTIKAEFKQEAEESRAKGDKPQPYDEWAQRKAYELAAQGFDKDSVVSLLRQDTQLSLADANSYYDAIMADIEVNDARITELVKQARSNPGATGSVATAVYQETVKQRQRGNRTVDPNAVSDDHATRTRALLSDPSNRFQGVTLSPFENKLANAYAKANAGNGFRYPSIAELQPISSGNRRQ